MTQSKRGESFNNIAKIYDLARPGYPIELVDDIINMANLSHQAKILDIGTGTGKGTINFADKGYTIHCIEPGENLIEIAKQNLKSYPKITFDITTFEDWNLQANNFDLAISAQAFHWVNREIGYSKVAQALKEKGYIAFFWNFTRPSDAIVFRVLKEALKKYLPSASDNPSIDSLIEKRKNWILNSNCFQNLIIKEYPWSIDLSAEKYLNLLKTNTVYQTLTQQQQQNLSREIIEIINNHGGTITKQNLSVLFFAQKIVS
ncbi:MAG: class I SAM-dependent methyltransferase [Cyanobacteria bacterium P01_D01_bin.50]